MLSPSLPPPHRRSVFFLWAILAAMPVAYIAMQVVVASRNIVFWDDFDSALDLILRINAGAGWRELLQRFFAISNEHRMVTSRLIYASSYWLTGTINFHVIGALGNLFLVTACAMLVVAVGGWERRIRLAVALAFLIFQLEHFENFLWSGASIDHFQVIMLAVAAIFALTRGTWKAGSAAVGFGLMATFTLAHGTVVWPVGALLLWHGRRWNQLAGWCACATIAGAAFLYRFEFNPGHHISAINLASFVHIGRYWLALLGGPLTLGDAATAPWLGVVLLTGLALVAWRGAATREPAAMFTALFAVGALALVAFGRSEIASSQINSRYLVLGALAWALLIFLLLEAANDPAHPFRRLVWLLPPLVAFNIAADRKFAPLAEGFIETRDRAATQFMQFGEDGKGPARLHPQPGHAEALLKMAYDRGVYKLPRVSNPVTFPNVQPSTKIVTYVDEMLTNKRAITIGGWAMLPGQVSKRGHVYLVLRSEKSFLIYSTLTLPRADVARAYKEPKWHWCGFRAVIGRTRLPAEDFQIGVLIADGGRAEYMMTSNRVSLVSENPIAVRGAPEL